MTDARSPQAAPAGRAGPARPRVADFERARVQRALRSRARYRYVRPRVLREGDALRVESPCCSRNVDKGGGVIDIALLQPLDPPGASAAPGAPGVPGTGGAGGGWRLHARDHANGRWVAHRDSAALDELVALLCADPARVFWP